MADKSDHVNVGRAIVSHGAVSEGKWAMEDVRLREIRDDELVVRMVASGICHTDLHFGDQKEGGYGVMYPSIKGHEGSGCVVRVGKAVKAASPGDPVLLSFSSCGTCALCTSDHPTQCLSFNDINFLGGPDYTLASSSISNPTSTSTNTNSPTIAGRFFGQSSFASLSIVSEQSVINVKGLVQNEEELKLLAPLGCGIQTGSGTIAKLAGAGVEDVVAIFGMGGVGLSGIMVGLFSSSLYPWMKFPRSWGPLATGWLQFPEEEGAAKICNCKTIIGIDKVASRLQLAKDLGATHTINTASLPSLAALIPAIRALTPSKLGPTITMDTTGHPHLIATAVEFTAPRGKILQVGTAPMDAKLEIPIFEFMVQGKQYIGAIEGDSVTSESVPRMIGWWREGRFPVERLVKFFRAEEFEEAVREMKEGRAVKPVIVW
ncbi:GroES-like protein [Lepidopterella palustris CBS 459.81]|uniref:GroES-like protein n=1 Tax=Lepidopterella palustris CBS 459.81 TaxID=1314670 RepID=A0A8E2JEL9_9PEZI|nr:GroES-like protein [Lepidopterella palustris CBS 459.81]